MLFGAAGQAAEPGAMSGSFSVSESGEASYQIPITVPPGTAGMAPALSLGYSSRSGNGVFGYGWTLGGMSVVTRCGQSMAIDGAIDGVDYDSGDRFCIDGQRLIAISGTYGASGTEYRTEIDGFTKVVSNGTAGSGPESFTAWTKGGQKLEYGATADSRIERQGQTDVRLWAVSEISDTAGNYLTVDYTEDTAKGNYRPDRIDYTGNAGASLTPYASVRFTYETRTDVSKGYFGGNVIEMDQRAIAIQTYEGATLVRDYRVAYEALATKSRIETVTECDGAGKCLRPVTFTWKVEQAGLFETQTHPIAHYTGDWTAYPPVPEDYTGDGVTDLALVRTNASALDMYLYVGKNDKTFEAQTHPIAIVGDWSEYKPFPGDYNGDGLVDLAVIRSSNYGVDLYLSLSNGDGTFAAQTHPVAVAGGWSHYKPFPGDYNGDGLIDLAVIHTGVSGVHLYLNLNNGDGTFAAQTHPVATGGDWTPYDAFPGDYNGDGIIDLGVGRSTGSGADFYLYLGNGDGTFAAQTHPITVAGGWSGYTVQPADYNGDGISDFGLVHSGVSGIHLYLNLAKGDGTFEAQTHPVANYSGDWSQYAPLITDYTADGIADLAVIHSGISGFHLYLYESNGDGTFAAQTHPVAVAGGWSQYQPDARDYTADGIVDLAAIHAGVSGIHLYINEGKDGAVSQVTKITDSLGAETDVVYTPLTDDTVYTKGTGATYPEIDIQAPMQAVSSVKADDGLGAQRETTYSYEGLRIRLDGRGSLGFAASTVTDVLKDISSRTEFSQTHPYIGMPTDTERKIGTVLLAESTAVLDSTQTHAGLGLAVGHPGTRFPFVASSTQKEYEPDSTFSSSAVSSTNTTARVFDTYGNATSITEARSGKNLVADPSGTGADETYTTATTSTYLAADTTNWILGRLATAAVTQMLPDATAASRKSAFTYDGTTGLLLSETVEPDTPALKLTTSYVRDAFGNITSETVGDGAGGVTDRETTTAYDLQGRFATSVTNALSHVGSSVYDGRFGAVTSRTDPNGHTTVWTLDGFGRVLTETRPDNSVTTIAREWCNGALGETGASNCPTTGVLVVTTETSGAPTTTTITDLLGREVRTGSVAFDGQAVHIDTDYDGHGRVVMQSKPYFGGSASAGTPPAPSVYTSWDPVGTVATLSNNNLTMTYAPNSQHTRARSTVSADGKVYAELTHNGGAIGFGLIKATGAMSGYVGQDANTWGFYDNEASLFMRHNGASTTLTSTTSSSDVLQIAYDPVAGKLWLGKNDTWYDSSGGPTGNPSAGTNPTFSSVPADLYLVSTAVTGSTTTLHPDPASWSYSAPTGFEALTEPPPPPGYATWDQTGSAVTLSNNDLTLTYASSAHRSARSTLAANGKIYAELDYANGPYVDFGVMSATGSLDNYVGYTAQGWSIYVSVPSTKISRIHNMAHSTLETGAGLGTGVFMVAYDPDAGKLWLGRNGVWYGSSGTAISQSDVENGISPTYSGVPSGLYLAASVYGGATATLATDPMDWAYTAPSGFGTLGTPPASGGMSGAGDVGTTTHPNGYERIFSYDSLDRVKEELRADNSKTTTAYAALKATTTNDKNQVITRVHDVRGKLVMVTDAGGEDTVYSYDHFGNLVEVEDASANITTNTFDTRGRKTAMTDPDMGSWTYAYNVFGELTSQTDALAQTVTLTYDILGRLIERDEAEGITSWTYDTAQDGSGATNYKGLLTKEVSAEGKTVTYSYDSLSRPSDSETVIDAVTYATGQTYDTKGRVDTVIYPSSPDYVGGLEVKNTYNANGYLSQVTNESDASAVVWTADAADSDGNIIQQTLGNGVVTTKTFNTQTGLIDTIKSVKGATTFQDDKFTFDTLGTLTQRQNVAKSLTEDFTYDTLNRMTQSQVVGQTAKSYTYDVLGNLLTKTGIGTYTYGAGAAGPHAVTSVDEGGTIRSMTYDANGNLLTGWNFTAAESRTTTWTSYNKPKEISQSPSGKKSTFSYGANRARFKQVTDDGLANLTTRIYIGSAYEKETKPGGLTIHHHYIRAGSTTVSIVKSKSAGAKEVRYTHRDHLGSLTYITNETGTVVEELAFDPHGKRRNPLAWTDAIGQITALETVRGFTGHENLDNIGLIHMNGRVYDPDLGRFMSADPNVQSEQNTQSLNRYTYVLNNPLSFTDPSGFFFKGFFKKLFNVLLDLHPITKAIWKKYPWMQQVDAFAASFVPVVGPFLSGFIASGGDFKAGLISFATAMATRGIASGYSQTVTTVVQEGATGQAIQMQTVKALTRIQKVTKAVAQGVVKGAAAQISGGKFLKGFTMSLAKSFVKIGWDEARIDTNRLAKLAAEKSGGIFTYDKFGNVRSDGVTAVEYGTDDNGVPYTSANESWLAFGAMGQQGSGDHLYSEGSFIGWFVNMTSKLHDWQNSFGYNPNTGAFISRSTFYNTAFDVYSVAGMLPAAAITGVAVIPEDNTISLNRLQNRQSRREEER